MKRLIKFASMVLMVLLLLPYLTFDGRVTYKLISGREFYIAMQGRVYRNSNRFIKDISHQDTYYSEVLSS